jgi:hypothetical protein
MCEGEDNIKIDLVLRYIACEDVGCIHLDQNRM